MVMTTSFRIFFHETTLMRAISKNFPFAPAHQLPTQAGQKINGAKIK
jgi:hypothetical protein